MEDLNHREEQMLFRTRHNDTALSVAPIRRLPSARRIAARDEG